MKNTKLRRFSLLMGISCIASGAYAQGPAIGAAERGDVTPGSAPTSTPDVAAAGTGVADIVVTARRQSESLQRTPVAVTALEPTALERGQIADIRDVQRSAPNLTISSRGPNNGSLTFLSIRGQVNLSGASSSDPAVGVYVDGAYIGRPGGALVDLIDVERVEILRGPQGTLFGRNTTGGALNIISHQPVDEFEGSVQLRYGNYSTIEATGIVNVPITSQLAARFVYQRSQHDGYGHNAFLDREVDDKKSDFYRASIKWTSTDGDADFTVTADQTNRKDHGQLAVFVGYNPLNPRPNQFARAGGPDENGPGAADDTLDPYIQTSGQYRTNFSGEPEFARVRTRGVSALLNLRLGGIALKSITAYRDLRSSGLNDTDGTPYRLLRTSYENEQDQFSQELQLTGEAGKFSWIGGLFYFSETPTEVTNSINYVSTILTGGEVLTENDATAKARSYAAYGQLYFQATDRLRFSAGARYTYDKRTVILRNLTSVSPFVCALPVADRDDGNSCAQTRKANFDYISYLLGGDFQATDDIFLYAKTSRAFLAGGFNTRNGAVPSYAPERLTDYEVGIKANWFDRRLRTNIALFYGQQGGLQRTSNDIIPATGQPVQFIRNAGTGRIRGMEFEGTAVPWEGMEVTASLGVTRARYKRFTEVQNIGTAAAPVLVTVDRSGEEPVATPDYTLSVGATQRVPVAIGTLVLHADYAYTDDVTYFTNTIAPGGAPALIAANERALELGRVKGYGLLNAQIALEIDQPEITLALYAKNITKTNYYARTFADQYTTLGFAQSYPAEPRIYGISAAFNF